MRKFQKFSVKIEITRACPKSKLSPLGNRDNGALGVKVPKPYFSKNFKDSTMFSKGPKDLKRFPKIL